MCLATNTPGKLILLIAGGKAFRGETCEEPPEQHICECEGWRRRCNVVSSYYEAHVVMFSGKFVLPIVYNTHTNIHQKYGGFG